MLGPAARLAALLCGCGWFAACSLVDPVPDLSSGARATDGAADVDDAAVDVLPDVSTDGGPPYEAVIMGAQPLAYFRFGESAGPSAADERKRAAGTYLPGCALGALGVTPRNTAVSLGGADAGVEIRDIDFSGRESFSIEAWIHVRTLDAENRNVFQKDETTGTGRHQFGAFVRSPEGFVFERTVAGASETVSGALVTGRYTHVVASYDGDRLALYINGVRVQSKDDTREQASKPTPPLRIGFDPAIGVAGSFDGIVDELAIYDRALDPSEVSDHFARVPLQ